MRHRAFIIEDTPAIAEILADLVRSEGHDVVIATTLEEVRRVIREERFCYVLLDLQFPAEVGERASLGNGDTALAELRNLERRRGPDDGHLLPIIIITGYAAQSPEFASKMHKRGADSFITKPFGDGVAVVETIREELAKAGHEDHGACGELWGERMPEKAHESARPATAAAPSPRIRMVFDGMIEDQCSGVLVNGARCLLQNALFTTLLRFAAAHLREPGRQLEREAMKLKKRAPEPSRVTKFMAAVLPPKLIVIENNRGGQFRLNPEISVEIHFEAYSDHSNGEVREIARKELARRVALSRAHAP